MNDLIVRLQASAKRAEEKGHVAMQIDVTDLKALLDEVETAPTKSLKLLASAVCKILPPAELDRFVALLDPDRPLNDFLKFLRSRA